MGLFGKDKKRNLLFFEGQSMQELYGQLESWQTENDTRFLSLSIEQDSGKFCCIALTCPVDVNLLGGGI